MASCFTEEEALLNAHFKRRQMEMASKEQHTDDRFKLGCTRGPTPAELHTGARVIALPEGFEFDHTPTMRIYHTPTGLPPASVFNVRGRRMQVDYERAELEPKRDAHEQRGQRRPGRMHSYYVRGPKAEQGISQLNTLRDIEGNRLESNEPESDKPEGTEPAITELVIMELN